MEQINKNNDVLVTIGIPIYNAEKYLEQAIRSILNQSYTNWELLLINDGSTDGSMRIAQSFLDPRIKIIDDDGINKGLVFRLNQLSMLAKGVYYARMDADDIMHPERVEKQLAFLESHPDVDVVGSSYYSIDLNNTIIGRVNINPSPKTVNDILSRGCFAHPSIMGHLSWFKKNQYDATSERMEDFELWLRTIAKSKFVNLQEPLLFYRNIGIPAFQKYMKSNNGIIKLIQSRKKYDINFQDSIKYSCIYGIKSIIYFFFYCLGQIDYLIKKRSVPISIEEKNSAAKNLTISIRE